MKLEEVLNLYMGCDYRISYVETPETFTVWSKLTPKRMTYLDDLSISKMQLALRPLSDMTEEECADVYTIERDRILHPPTDDHDVRRINDCWKIVRLDHIDTSLFISDNAVINKVTEDNGKPMIEIMRNLPEIFHYLLSKHFDLFNLIESGQAINSTTLTNNNHE